jgi:hypothetical protein
MRIPNKIQIGPYIYSVELADDLHDRSTGQSLWGRIDSTEQKITLHANGTPERMGETLLHELIHGCADQAGIELEESIVTGLSISLYDTLVRNGLDFHNSKDLDLMGDNQGLK